MRLVVDNLNAFYGRAQVLFDVTLEAGSHEVLALIGRNGAGKSTTFKSIVGLVASRRGRIDFNHNINFDPIDISCLPVHRIVEMGLGYVPEDRRIFTDLTVEENLDVGTQLPRDGVPHWTKERLYELFPNLAEMRKRPAGRMSGGEQQMLTIARSLMGNPSLIMLDEPSEGLAPKIVEDMAYAILAMKKEGLAVMISEQNLHFAKMISNRAYIIEKGRICYEGSMADLAANDEIRNKYLAV
ncbi:MAG TPA: ABC transporter ATP-binding protein [Telmatospirillum sp.]|nr:ABC transporter ATP-binding protein [Telmatospirillum sp.]